MIKSFLFSASMIQPLPSDNSSFETTKSHLKLTTDWLKKETGDPYYRMHVVLNVSKCSRISTAIQFLCMNFIFFFFRLNYPTPCIFFPHDTGHQLWRRQSIQDAVGVAFTFLFDTVWRHLLGALLCSCQRWRQFAVAQQQLPLMTKQKKENLAPPLYN